MRNIVSLVIVSFLLSTAVEAQELIKINDTLYRATKDVPIIISINNTSVYLETTNFGREQANVPIDTIISRACTKYFKATLQDGRVFAFNKDFIRRVASRTSNRSYIYMIHTPTRYDILESVSVLAQRMALCGGIEVIDYQELYVQGDSLYITNGNGVPFDSMFAGVVYTAGAGIDISDNVITNTGDTNPNDDVLKTTNHDGDVTGVYNNLVVKPGVITINKLDSLNVLTWIIDNFPLIDSTRFDTTNILTWIYNHVDTTDLDEQTLYIQGDSLYITNGNGIPLDSIRSGGLPAAQRGETLWFDGTDWIADSSVYNDGVQVGVHAPVIYPGTMTVYGDTIMTFAGDTTYLRVVTKGNNILMDFKGEWFMVKDSAELTAGFGVRSGTGAPRYEVAIPGKITIGGIHDHSSGESNAMFFGQDAMTGTILDGAPSGTATYNTIKIAGQINQFTGSGATRGIFISPALNGAADYRAIEIANSTGIGISQTGALTTNRILGKTSFGSLLSPARDLHNYGETRLQTPVPNANGLAGIHLANGDVSHVALGAGFTMSGDTLYFDGEIEAVSNLEGANLGGGAEVYKNKVDTTLNFRTLVGAGGTTVTQSGDTIIIDGVAAGAAGQGTVNYVAKWTPDTITLGDSQIFDDGQKVGINTETANAMLTVQQKVGSDGPIISGRTGADNIFSINNAGRYSIGSAGTPSYIHPVNGNVAASVLSGTTIGHYSMNQSIGHWFGGTAMTNTSGENYHVRLSRTFTGTGTGNFTGLLVDPTMNYSSSGTAYGIRVEPLLTAAPTWVSLYLNASSGTGILQNGASVNNMLHGKLHVGATTAAIRTLQSTGTLRVTGNVDTASINRLWVGNTEGDLRRAVIGSGLSVSNDTIRGSYVWTLDDGTNDGPIEGGEVLTVLGTGTVTASFVPGTNTLTIDGAGPAGDGGETNLGLNVGPGQEIYKGKTDTTLLFRTLVDQGITTVTQTGDSIIITTPAQTLSTSGDSIFISLGNGVKVPGVPPAGTVLNSTLRWDGSNWVENDSLLVNAKGESGYGGQAIDTIYSISAPKDIVVADSVVVGSGNGANIILGHNINSVGTSNVLVGTQIAQGSSGSLIRNTVVGQSALNNFWSGTDNVAYGYQSLRGGAGTITGNFNSGIGASTLLSRTSASSNTAIGESALRSTTASGSNTAVGANAMRATSGTGRTFNTVVGNDAGYNIVGSGNSFFGASAGYNSDASHSVFLGRNAGFSVDKDSTLLIDVTSDTVATIVGDFRGKKVGINRNPYGITQTLDVGGTLRVRDDVTLDPVRLWASDTLGNFRRVFVGDGLGFVNDTLKSTYVAEPAAPYALAHNPYTSSYNDTIAPSNSSTVLLPQSNQPGLFDWTLNSNQLTYDGLDTFVAKIQIELDIEAPDGTILELRLRSNQFGAMSVIHRRRVELTENVANVSLDWFSGVPQAYSDCGADAFDIQITNASGTQRIFTIHAVTMTIIKVSPWVPFCGF